MKAPETIAELRQMIAVGVEENTHLEYKAADALQNTDGKKKEIAKDVSAMANAAGGLVLYGVKEFDEKSKKHLPEKITPIKRKDFSKEQLDQVINSNISPKIDGLSIYPIAFDNSEEAIYVVEIPQSNTAHQNTKDQRYYKRYNFEVLPMLDHEIRDVMNRTKHPMVELKFEIEAFTYEVKSNAIISEIRLPLGKQQCTAQEKQYSTVYSLKIIPVNRGNSYAQFVNYFVELPANIIDKKEAEHLNSPKPEWVEYYGENTYRDVLDVKLTGLGGAKTTYGPSRFDPILPGLRGRSEKLKLAENPYLDDREITWTVHADNAPPRSGKINLVDICITRTKQKEGNDE